MAPPQPSAPSNGSMMAFVANRMRAVRAPGSAAGMGDAGGKSTPMTRNQALTVNKFGQAELADLKEPRTKHQIQQFFSQGKSYERQFTVDHQGQKPPTVVLKHIVLTLVLPEEPDEDTLDKLTYDSAMGMWMSLSAGITLFVVTQLLLQYDVPVASVTHLDKDEGENLLNDLIGDAAVATPDMKKKRSAADAGLAEPGAAHAAAGEDPL